MGSYLAMAFMWLLSPLRYGSFQMNLELVNARLFVFCVSVSVFKGENGIYDCRFVVDFMVDDIVFDSMAAVSVE